MRRALHDYTDTDRAGEFWDDYFLKLCLRAAQDSVVNICVRRGLTELMRRLVSSVGSTGGPVAVPADYLNALSARIESGGLTRFCQVYIGAEAIAFQTAGHDAALIIQDTITFLDNGNTGGAGTLNYHRQPTPMLLPADPGFSGVQEFDLRVYDYVLQVAVSLAANKATNMRLAAMRRERTALALATEPVRGVYLPDASAKGMPEGAAQ